MMKWTTKFSTVLGCALAAVFLFTSTMEVGAVPLTSSPSGTTTTTTTDTNAAEDGNADAAAEDNAAEDNAAGTAAAGTVTSATVTSSSVNIRSEASTSASIAGKATSGQELTVTGETQGSDGKTWYAVTFDNVSGYIRSDLVEAHVSEATAEPTVDESQETEEPEEEPIVDNSADYSVAFEDDGSGSSAWYLHDNTMGTRYQVSDLLNAEETNKNNQATIDQTAKSMRFVVILMAFVIVVLIIVVTILIIKVRSTYEDYDDYDDDEEDDEDDEDDKENISLKNNDKVFRWVFRFNYSRICPNRKYKVIYVMSIPGMYPIKDGKLDINAINDEQLLNDLESGNSTSIRINNPIRNFYYTISFESDILLEREPKCILKHIDQQESVTHPKLKH